MNSYATCNLNTEYRTDFLFWQITFLDSVTSIFTPFKSGVKINYSNSSEEADAKALKCDFWMVGQDLRKAMDTFNSENQK